MKHLFSALLLGAAIAVSPAFTVMPAEAASDEVKASNYVGIQLAVIWQSFGSQLAINCFPFFCVRRLKLRR